MTEPEWWACTDPQTMLAFLGDRASDRKLRLFVCACCRWVDGLLADVRGLGAVETAERYADGTANPEELAAARDRAIGVAELDWYHNYGWCWDLPGFEEWPTVLAAELSLGPEQTILAAEGAVQCATDLERLGQKQKADDVRAAQAALLRDVFGNPFRPLEHAPAWRTPIVRSLAEAAYQERILPAGGLDPLRLAMLADALEELGAASDLIDHLRGPGPHIRGCAAVDLLLSGE
jgi:hypothetical protein